MSELSIEGLTMRYRGAKADAPAAVDDFSLTVGAGEFLVLLGPSGCGKTTVLRSVAGLLDPSKGRISINGRVVYDAAGKVNVPIHRRGIGMVFQNYALWPHLTVRSNVDYPLSARRVRRQERVRRVENALKLVSCWDLADRYPSQLSGGQQQRVALARALVAEPRLLLLDEPLSNLDALLRHELRAQLATLHEEVGFTAVYVTHDQAEALNLGTSIAVMREGRVEQVGSPSEIYGRPRTPYVAAFLGIRNHYQVYRADGCWRIGDGVLEGWDPPAAYGSADLQLFVRPKDVQLEPTDGGFQPGYALLPKGRVSARLFGGDSVEYVIDVAGIKTYVTRPATMPLLEVGQEVRAGFARAAELLYVNGELTSRKR